MNKEERKKVIESYQTGNGGFSKKTLAKFGVKWPPKKGWKKELIDNPNFNINESLNEDTNQMDLL